MAVWKIFKEFWENSGILETDAFTCIAETCEFTKDNVLQALQSQSRTIWRLSGIDGYNAGHKSGYEDCDKSWKAILDVVTILLKGNGDQKMNDDIIKILKNK